MKQPIKNPVNCWRNSQEHLTDVLSSLRIKMMTHSSAFFKYEAKHRNRRMCYHGKK